MRSLWGYAGILIYIVQMNAAICRAVHGLVVALLVSFPSCTLIGTRIRSFRTQCDDLILHDALFPLCSPSSLTHALCSEFALVTLLSGFCALSDCCLALIHSSSFITHLATLSKLSLCSPALFDLWKLVVAGVVNARYGPPKAFKRL